MERRLHTGSFKKHENWKTTWGLLTCILESMKGHLTKHNARKVIKLNKICEKLVRCFLNFIEL